MTLSNRAMLVTVSISQWAARKLDKAETKAVTVKHAATTSAARVNKNLLPMAASLDRVHKATSSVRQEFYRRTLPWGDTGSRVLSVDGYFDFVEAMRKETAEWRSSVDQFLQDYDSLRADAKVFLNTLYKDEDYPSRAEVERKFALDMSFCPIPETTDFRVEMSADAVEELKASLTAGIASATSIAMQDAWSRVKAVVERAHERLSQPDALFKDTLVDARDLCAILPTLNITGDKDLEKVRQDLERSLCSVEPDALRNLPNTRKDVADKMADVMSKMGAYFA